MTSAELKDKYTQLYDYMAVSQEPKYMKVFGHVMTEMMEWMLANKPAEAEEWLCKLESIKWKQYLTPKEAEKIVANMNPSAPWSRDVWEKAMDSFGLPVEEQPNYNRCALFVEMNKMYSDFGEEIASLLGKPLAASDPDIIAACYKMALKTLKDKDGVYDIRRYFNV